LRRGRAILLVALALTACDEPKSDATASASASAAVEIPSALAVELLGGPAAPAVEELPKRMFRVTDDGRRLPVVKVLAYHEHGESITVLFALKDVSCKEIDSLPADKRVSVTITPTFHGPAYRVRRAAVGPAERDLSDQTEHRSVEVVSGDARPGSKLVLRLDVEFEGLGDKPHRYRIEGGGAAEGCGMIERKRPKERALSSTLTVQGRKLPIRGAILHAPRDLPRLELSTSPADCRDKGLSADVVVGVDLTADGGGVRGVDVRGDYLLKRVDKGLVPETSPLRVRLGGPLEGDGSLAIAIDGQVLLDAGWEIRFSGGIDALRCAN
jgi:hypothetical protein